MLEKLQVGKVTENMTSLYNWIMKLSTVQKVAGVVTTGIIVYYVYIHFFTNKEGMEDGKDGILRFFYADWCPHCKKSKPEWEQLLQKYKGTIQLKAVDCTNGATSIAKQLDVEGFPTFVLSKNGKNIEYNGKRNANSLLMFLEDK